MGFIFHYTRHFFCVPTFECEFRFFFYHINKWESIQFLTTSQTSSFFLPPFLISISYFMMFMVFNVMPHGFASKPCSQKYEIAF